jgi:hypothetical protein
MWKLIRVFGCRQPSVDWKKYVVDYHIGSSNLTASECESWMLKSLPLESNSLTIADSYRNGSNLTPLRRTEMNVLNQTMKFSLTDRECSISGDKWNAYGIFYVKPGGEIIVGKPIRWLENNIKMFLGRICWSGVDKIDQTLNRDQLRVLLNMAMNFRDPRNVGMLLSSYSNGSFSRKSQLNAVSLV